MVMVKTTMCNECGAAINYEPCILNGRELFTPTRCDACLCAQEARQAASEAEARVSMRNAEWERICPPIYRDTEIARLPAEFRAVISAWKYGPRGVGFFGPAGQCKTRAAFLILSAQHFAGRQCAAVSAIRFSREAVDQFSDSPERRFEAKRRLEEFRTVKLLLLDDLGKGKMTDRAELELFDVLEERTSHELPTIWTANANSTELGGMLSNDRREPILRRLCEFSEIISAK